MADDSPATQSARSRASTIPLDEIDVSDPELWRTDSSSEAALGGITIDDETGGLRLPMFIAMDPPKHDAQRKPINPVVSPTNLALLEPLIRERAQRTLDSLPRGETFDWVDRVSIELTTQMLATLFGFPFEQRRKLTFWSDVATTLPGRKRRQFLREGSNHEACMFGDRRGCGHRK
jgi:cytochrome P450